MFLVHLPVQDSYAILMLIAAHTISFLAGGLKDRLGGTKYGRSTIIHRPRDVFHDFSDFLSLPHFASKSAVDAAGIQSQHGTQNQHGKLAPPSMDLPLDRRLNLARHAVHITIILGCGRASETTSAIKPLHSVIQHLFNPYLLPLRKRWRH